MAHLKLRKIGHFISQKVKKKKSLKKEVSVIEFFGFVGYFGQFSKKFSGSRGNFQKLKTESKMDQMEP